MAGTVADAPYFVVFTDEGVVFAHGGAFGDEPGHVEDFQFGVVGVAVDVRSFKPVSECICAGKERQKGSEA